MEASEVRQCDLSYAQQGDRTGFSDGFPLLLISEASLEDLNQKLVQNSSKPVTMQRFRPNLVVKGCDAFAEDQWQNIHINQISFRIVKPCSRCIVTTVNPKLGIVSSPEPLRTLATYRKKANKILFGQNVIHNQTGVLNVGDCVKI